MKGLFILILIFICFIHCKQPNIILIVADDLGFGDVHFNGNKSVESPNLDELAKSGAKLTQLLTTENVCTPSRAAMLTGRYPIRSGMASSNQNMRMLISPAQPGGLPQNETTIAEVLKKKGYSTALIGKWHLGLHKYQNDFMFFPTNQGYDYFYGMPLTNSQKCGGKSMQRYRYMWMDFGVRSYPFYVTVSAILLTLYFLNFVSTKKVVFFFLVLLSILCLHYYLFENLTVFSERCCTLYRNHQIVEQPTKLKDLTLRYTHEVTKFIKNNKEKPFFLTYSSEKVHTYLDTVDSFKGKSKLGVYGDCILEMDWSVGNIVKTLENLNLLEDTLIIFTSDNGPYLEELSEGGGAGYVLNSKGKKAYLKGGKGTNWEGGIRVPGIVSWKGHIPPNTVINEAISQMDFFPLAVELSGTSIESLGIKIDGKNPLPLLKQQTNESLHEVLFHYCGEIITSARMGNYKIHWTTPKFDQGVNHCQSMGICACTGHVHDPPLIFDLQEDPSETNNISPTHPLFHSLLQKFISEKSKHLLSVVPVPSQMTFFPRPWLMPCCGDFCNCTENFVFDEQLSLPLPNF